MGRYSKLEPLQTLPEDTAYRSLPQDPPPRVHKLDQRLDPTVIAEIVAAYEAGTSSVKLMRTYGLGKGSVLKLLHEAGVQIRKPGPQPGT
jgi:hypothetical protein